MKARYNIIVGITNNSSHNKMHIVKEMIAEYNVFKRKNYLQK